MAPGPTPAQAASAARRENRDWSSSDSFGFRGSACVTSVMRPTASDAARTSGSPTATVPVRRHR